MTARPRYFDALIDPASVIARTSAAVLAHRTPRWDARPVLKPAADAAAPNPPKRSPSATVVLEALRNGPLDRDALIRATGTGRENVQRVTRQLKNSGAIVLLTDPHSPRPGVWALAQETKR